MGTERKAKPPRKGSDRDVRAPSSEPPSRNETPGQAASDEFPSAPRHRVRQVVNILNLSTLIGLLLATIGRATFSRGPRHTVLATSLRLPIKASAMTIGNVVMTRKTREDMLGRAKLLRHELRHATQYAWCIGPVMLVLYGFEAAWSWMLTSDPASRNIFERLAGLEDGNYPVRPLRPVFQRLRRRRRAQ